jgi:death-on-curing protein
MNQLPPDALTFEEVLEIQRQAVEATGGTIGLLHPEVLESALLRPYQAVFGEELYPSPFDKAAVLAQTIAHNHPFYDGNKRTATLVSREFLRRAGYYLPLEEYVDETEEVILHLATGQISWQEFSTWLKAHVRPLSMDL